jgi:hypothetical protein
MRNKVWYVGLASLALVASAAFTAGAQGKVRGMMRLGGDYGGDKVLELEYTDGSSPDVQAGGGILFSGGAAMQLLSFADQALDVQASVGVKYRTIPEASNQSLTWMRFPVEGLLMYRAPMGLRAGGGVSMHFGNRIEAEGAAVDGKIEFKTTPGYVVQTGYGRGPWAIDLRYTLMKYEMAGVAEKVNANSLGAGLSWSFGGGARSSALQAQ